MHGPAVMRCLVSVAVFALAAFAGPTTAFSSPPANDNLDNATLMSSLPFTDSGNLIGTTTEPGVIATIMGGRDAISADNTAIAAPTRVNP